MKVFGIFIKIVLLVKILLAERNPAHGLMRVTGNNGTMSKDTHSFNHQLSNRGNWYKRPRIFGGNEVKSIEDFPYMAFMTLWESDVDGNRIKIHFCGATILNRKYLLTAAHCVTNCTITKENMKTYVNCRELDQESYTIYVGSVAGQSALNIAKVKTWHIHPEYHIIDVINNCTHNHDLAILELRRPLQFNSKICNVDLPLAIPNGNVNYPFASRNCKVVGWGFTGIFDSILYTTDDMLKRRLKVARINVIDTQECLHYLHITNPNIDLLCQSTQICTKDPQNIIGTCHGDSGGPIICDGVQIGVMSFVSGKACVGPILVQIYSRVDVSMEWIRSIISKEEEDFYGYVDSGCRRK